MFITLSCDGWIKGTCSFPITCINVPLHFPFLYFGNNFNNNSLYNKKKIHKIYNYIVFSQFESCGASVVCWMACVVSQSTRPDILCSMVTLGSELEHQTRSTVHHGVLGQCVRAPDQIHGAPFIASPLSFSPSPLLVYIHLYKLESSKVNLKLTSTKILSLIFKKRLYLDCNCHLICNLIMQDVMSLITGLIVHCLSVSLSLIHHAQTCV